MPKIVKGSITLSQAEIDRVKPDYDGVRQTFTYYTKETGDYLKLKKSEFESLVKSKKGMKEIIAQLKTSRYYLKYYMKKKYGTPNFYKVKKIIN